MRSLVVVLTILFTNFSALAQEPTPAAKGVQYGKGTSAEAAISINALSAQMNEQGYTGKITGTVTEVCQEKGCWMKIQRDNAAPMMVKFKDYGFFMPKNIVGKLVVLEGVATEKEISVDQLRHYAEDAGKSKKEIKKIKKPQKDILFTANGVLVLSN